MRAVVVALVVVTAGCVDPTPEAFDGSAALAFIAGLLEHNGTAVERYPGSAGHAWAATYLEESLAVSGWTVWREPFSYADYADLPKGEAETYTTHSFCPPERRAQVEDLSFVNLIAERPSNTGRTLLLGAHWDAKRHAGTSGTSVPGANDGASGVGLLLQLQRELEGLPLPYGIRIVLFDGEDGFEDCHPLAGSVVHAHGLAEGEIGRMILLDMVGDAEARFVRERKSVRCDPDLVDLVWSLGAARGMQDHFTTTERAIVDDHHPFADRNIPAMDIVDAGRERGFPPYWHTAEDTLDKLDAQMLGDMGDLMLDVLRHPQMAAAWPSACRAT